MVCLSGVCPLWLPCPDLFSNHLALWERGWSLGWWGEGEYAGRQNWFEGRFLSIVVHWRRIIVYCSGYFWETMFWIVRIKHASVLVHKNRSPRYQQFLLHGSYFARAFLLLTSWTQSPIMQGYLYLTVLVQINMFWLNLSTSWLRITAIEFDTDLWWVM